MAYDPNTIIQNAISTSNQMAANAAGALNSALNSGGGWWLGAEEIEFPITAIAREDINAGSPPTFSGQFHRPERTYGDAPEYADTPDPYYGALPTNTAVKPSYISPTVPSALAEFTGTAPDINNITVPDAPSFPTAFDPPTLLDIVVPGAPTTTLPEFTAVSPVIDFSAPDNLDVVLAENFVTAGNDMRRVFESEVDNYLTKINPEYHNQMASLEAKLASFLMGGTALSVEVEQAIYNRARDKTNAEYLKTRDTIFAEGAKRGFTIPGGAQYSALSQARQAAADNNARAAMDIAIKQAELEQQNMQFAVTQSANLRGVVLNATVGLAGNLVQLNGQALEYAKQLVGALLEVYNARIKLVTTMVEIYKADAAVYESRLKAALAVYEVYKAELEGIRAQVDIDQAKVAAFTAQVNAWGAVASLYKAQVEGAMAAAQIEKVRADIFGTEVQAYSAQVNAKQAEWQGFTAQVNGNNALASIYKTEVEAYGEEVRAYQTKVQGYTAEVQAVATRNEAAARVYTASIQGYTAAVQGAAAEIQADVSQFDGQIKAHIAKLQESEAQAKVNLSANESNLRAAIQLYVSDSANRISSAKVYSDSVNGRAQVAVAAGNSYAHMASSALAGMNALAQTSEITNL